MLEGSPYIEDFASAPKIRCYVYLCLYGTCVHEYKCVLFYCALHYYKVHDTIQILKAERTTQKEMLKYMETIKPVIRNIKGVVHFKKKKKNFC